MVERDLPKVDVASSNLVIRSGPVVIRPTCVPAPITAFLAESANPGPYSGRVTFVGFPVAALDFYDDLEIDNTKSFWADRATVYADAVKEPMLALCAALEPEFGPAKVFRPYRDVRFARDKTPYKTHQGAFVQTAPATGWYVEVSARGVRGGAGCYGATSRRLAAIREAIDDERSGADLARILGVLSDAGWVIGGDRVKTSPRGYPADHPRIDLLRHKSLTAIRDYGFDPVIHTPELTERIRADWRRLRPLVSWLTEIEEGGVDG